MDTVPGCYAVLPVGCLSSALNALDASISNTSSVLSLVLERKLYVGKKTQKKREGGGGDESNSVYIRFFANPLQATKQARKQ